MPREKMNPDSRLTERLVILVEPQFLKDYSAMCEAIGDNRSEHIRSELGSELALYNSSRDQV